MEEVWHVGEVVEAERTFGHWGIPFEHTQCLQNQFLEHVQLIPVFDVVGRLGFEHCLYCSLQTQDSLYALGMIRIDILQDISKGGLRDEHPVVRDECAWFFANLQV